MSNSLISRAQHFVGVLTGILPIRKAQDVTKMARNSRVRVLSIGKCLKG
jgi:hypothetical protein